MFALKLSGTKKHIKLNFFIFSSSHAFCINTKVKIHVFQVHTKTIFYSSNTLTKTTPLCIQEINCSSSLNKETVLL